LGLLGDVGGGLAFPFVAVEFLDLLAQSCELFVMVGIAIRSGLLQPVVLLLEGLDPLA
jgi:hypothetical protein